MTKLLKNKNNTMKGVLHGTLAITNGLLGFCVGSKLGFHRSFALFSKSRNKEN